MQDLINELQRMQAHVRILDAQLAEILGKMQNPKPKKQTGLSDEQKAQIEAKRQRRFINYKPC